MTYEIFQKINEILKIENISRGANIAIIFSIILLIVLIIYLIIKLDKKVEEDLKEIEDFEMQKKLLNHKKEKAKTNLNSNSNGFNNLFKKFFLKHNDSKNINKNNNKKQIYVNENQNNSSEIQDQEILKEELNILKQLENREEKLEIKLAIDKLEKILCKNNEENIDGQIR